MEGQATGRGEAAHGVTPEIKINSSQESIESGRPRESSRQREDMGLHNFRGKKVSRVGSSQQQQVTVSLL